MQQLKWHLPLIAGAFLTFGGSALASPSDFCQTGTATLEQQRIDCAGRWVSADGTRLGPRFDPRDTPKTAHPGYRTRATASTHSTAYTTSAGHTPANVWTPPEPYGNYAAPVVVTRGNHTQGYANNYDVYVPIRAPLAPPPPPGYINRGNCGSRADLYSHSTSVTCGNAGYRAPLEGCFTLNATGQPHPVPCPVAQSRVYSNTAHHTPAPVAIAQASASASASVNITSSVFFNSLSGGVGGSVPIFYGGGGGAIISGGGGSVLSRAPLLRMRMRNRGRHGGGGGCNCGGGGMMGMGGGGD